MEPLTHGELKSIAAYFLHKADPHDLKQHSAFLDLYQDLTSCDAVIQIQTDCLLSHQHIRESAELLKKNASWTRKEFIRKVFPGYITSTRRGHDPVSVIVQLAFMLDCNSKDVQSRNRRVGQWAPTRWDDEEEFYKFVERTLPPYIQTAFPVQERRRMLVAWKLKRRCDVQIIATNNLAEHLLYDPQTGTLQVFHNTSWLKAQLEHSIQNPDDRSELIPQQLLAETLDTFYRILFPLNTDSKGKSRKLLDKLICDGQFDSNIASESYLPSEDIEYHYWGSRLHILAELAKHPPPTNRFTKWLERNKTDRNILWIAIAGLFLSAFFGLVSCIIGGLQLQAAYLALNQTNA